MFRPVTGPPYINYNWGSITVEHWTSGAELNILIWMDEPTSTPTATPPSDDFTLSGPDGNCRVEFTLDQGNNQPYYTVYYNNNVMLERSPLGITRSDQDFSQGLQVQNISSVQAVSDQYQLRHGKRRSCTYNANKRTITLRNQNGSTVEIEFQVSSNAVAFRYNFPESPSSRPSVTSEATGFAFPANTTVWMTPMEDAKTGWCETQPSYETHYVYGDRAGTPCPNSAGWCFPALFKIGNNGWVLISEILTNGHYCATRLAQYSSNRTYTIAFPQSAEYYTSDPVAPVISFPFSSPWRVIIVGSSLKPIVESTIITDLAEPRAVNDSFVQPGHSSWSWLQLKDEYTIYPVQQEFIDFAARMGWEYCLIDAGWDTRIGYDGIQDLVNYGSSRGVGILLWYNSSGPWNTTTLTPKDKMHDVSTRRREFSRIQQMGIKGVKVDFFGGDKQTSIQYYIDIFQDAARYNLMVYCHGATIPRGWERTYPNLMCTEGVRGMEYVTFGQDDGDKQPRHCTVLPFTRNVIGPMDFTPVVFNPSAGASVRRTTLGFELALSVVFQSGIQHFGLTNDEINAQPSYIEQFFNNLPAAWDDICFVGGYPGDYVVLARKSGNRWWIGGINGTSTTRNVTLDLSFTGSTLNGQIITDNSSSGGFVQKNISNAGTRNYSVSMRANGGFVIVTE